MNTRRLSALLMTLSAMGVIPIVRGVKIIKQSYKQLERYQVKTADLSYGRMTYVDQGSGETLLALHGIFGGYDQGYELGVNCGFPGRVIAPSRFGYLGSDVSGQGTPKEQARALVELLDYSGVDKTFVIGGSAGGTHAIRLALDFPERVKGVILYSSRMPLPKRPTKPMQYKYMGPPKFICNDIAMYLLSPVVAMMTSTPLHSVMSILPIGKRKAGAYIDSVISNPDMAKNFDDYRIESLTVPVLIFSAMDDRLIKFTDVEKVIRRFPNKVFVPFENGGHLIVGHDVEIHNTVNEFIARYR